MGRPPVLGSHEKMLVFSKYFTVSVNTEFLSLEGEESDEHVVFLVLMTLARKKQYNVRIDTTHTYDKGAASTAEAKQ